MANILAVDDAATMRQVVNFALTDAGHTVAEASGVDEALARAAKSKFDLVIADLNMPGKNGLELVKALRAMPEAGVTGWLVKPFDPTVLLDVVKKVLK